MSLRMIAWLAKILMVSLCLSVVTSRAQEQTGAKAPAATAEKPVSAYHLDFSVNELENGKKINARQYAMNLDTEDSNSLKIGTRVPVEAKQGEFQYIDVGTNIWSRLKERDNSLLLEVRCEISNFAVPGQANGANSMPVLRQIQINGSTIAFAGKPIVIGSVDDPNSTRQFQLEVTLTRLK